jgi:hypothetical protein
MPLLQRGSHHEGGESEVMLNLHKEVLGQEIQDFAGRMVVNQGGKIWMRKSHWG